MIKKSSQPRPAHRPSRREEIIDAAITVFGRAGYAAASVEDIALESGVAATAIYYHFGGKEELFNQTLRTALDRLSEATYAARMSGNTSAPTTLRRVISAGLARALSHPEETRFLLHHTFRPTPEARKLQQDWEERHVQRTFDYLPQPVVPPRTPREARIRHAAHLLASRVITYTAIVTQESRLDGGPLAELPVPQLAKALEDVCVRVVAAAGDSQPTAGKAVVRSLPAPESGTDSAAPKTPAKPVPTPAAGVRAPAKAAAPKTPAKAPAAKRPAAKAPTTKTSATKTSATRTLPAKAADTKATANQAPAKATTAKAPVAGRPATKRAAAKVTATPPTGARPPATRAPAAKRSGRAGAAASEPAVPVDAPGPVAARAPRRSRRTPGDAPQT